MAGSSEPFGDYTTLSWRRCSFSRSAGESIFRYQDSTPYLLGAPGAGAGPCTPEGSAQNFRQKDSSVWVSRNGTRQKLARARAYCRAGSIAIVIGLLRITLPSEPVRTRTTGMASPTGPPAGNFTLT